MRQGMIFVFAWIAVTLVSGTCYAEMRDKVLSRAISRSNHRKIEIRDGRVFVNHIYVKDVTTDDVFSSSETRGGTIRNDVLIKNSEIIGNTIRQKRFSATGYNGNMGNSLKTCPTPGRDKRVSGPSIGVKAGRNVRRVENDVTIKNSNVHLRDGVNTGVNLEKSRSIHGAKVTNKVVIKKSKVR